MNNDEFERVLREPLMHLRGVLIARYGTDIGRDGHGEVSEYAWMNRDRLGSMQNPAGFLYRVSQSRARRYRRWKRAADLPAEIASGQPEQAGDGRLAEALARLSRDERTVAVVVHAYGYSYEQAADLLGITPAAVRNRLHRAMAKLRRDLKEEDQL